MIRVLEDLNWNAPTEYLVGELLLALKNRYYLNSSENEKKEYWQIMIDRNIMASFLALKELEFEGKETQDKQRYELFSHKISVVDWNKKDYLYIADFWTILLMSDTFDEKCRDYLDILNDYEKTSFIYRIIMNAESSPFREEDVVNICIQLYTLFKDDVKMIELMTTAFGRVRFDYMLKDDMRLKAVSFIRDVVLMGHFRIASLLLKGFNIDVKELGISKETLVDILSKCNVEYYYRGIIFLQKLICENDLENEWDEWYDLSTSIRNDNEENEQEIIRFIYICSLIRINYSNPYKALKNKSMNISFKLKYYKRSKCIRAFRQMIYALIKNNSQYTRRILEDMDDVNADASHVTNYSERPGRVSKDIGDYNASTYLDIIKESGWNASDTIYIFMNTFLRAIISFDDFIDCLIGKYGDSVHKILNEIEVGGFLKKEKDTYYIVPWNIIGEKKMIFLDDESREFMNNTYIPNAHSWIDLKLSKIEIHDRKYYGTVMQSGTTNSIKKLLPFIKKKKDIKSRKDSPSYEERINYNKLHKDSHELFWDLNIAYLERLVDAVVQGEEYKLVEDYYRHVNYFHFYRDNGDKKWKSLPISREEFIRIRNLIDKSLESLKNNSASYKDYSFIYFNSLIKKIMTLGQFLDKIEIKTKAEIDEFLTIVPRQLGYVWKVERSDNDSTIVETTIDCVSLQLKKGRDYYERYVFEQKFEGTSLNKIRNIKKKVSFRIVDFDGKDTFKVEDIQNPTRFITR